MIVIFRQSRSSAPSSTYSVSLSSLPEVKTTRLFSSTVVDSKLEFVLSSSSVSLASIPSLDYEIITDESSFWAKVGDDVYGDDPTVNKLESTAKALGTATQLIETLQLPMIVIFRRSRSSTPSSTYSISLSSLPEVKNTTRLFSSMVVDSKLEFVSLSSSISLASIPSLPKLMASIDTMDESKCNNITHAIVYSPDGSDMFARIMFYFRLHARAIVVTTAFVSFVFVISMDTVYDAVDGEMTPQFLRVSRALYKISLYILLTEHLKS